LLKILILSFSVWFDFDFNAGQVATSLEHAWSRKLHSKLLISGLNH